MSAGAQLDLVALEAARKVEAIIADDHVGGQAQRQAKIQIAIAAAMHVARETTIEECAVAAEAFDRTGREWVRESLWQKMMKRAGANVRALAGS
jgi:hypothetical protein